MSQGEVRLVREGPVAYVTFDRPQARNAMTWKMYTELAAACAELKDDKSVRVVVFRGAGGNDTVCAGGGDDDLNGQAGNDTIRAGSGDDQLRGDTQNDSLYAQLGDDELFGGSGATDLCDGGSDTDTADLSCESVVGVP